MNAPQSNAPQQQAAANPARKKALLSVSAVVLLLGAAWGGWHLVNAGRYESTDNAYVQGHVVQITPQVGGTVLSVGADDTDFVRAGEVLVKLDSADAQVALDQAEAQLAQTVREVRTLYANNATLAAQIAARRADVARVQALVATGAVGREEFNHAQAQLNAAGSAVAAAQSALRAAEEQLASNQSLTDGTSVEQHPNVLRAAARVREAYLALKRVELPAPVDGQVARRNVQVGQRVQAGAPLMTLVSRDALWVDANFKEGQLRKLRIGQPATLVADVYGEKVEYHGTVAGLGAGTGAAFALLPAQNATGNWIKVVQRVPVRIALDPKDLQSHPLRVGLSMEAKVDVSQGDGTPLTAAAERGEGSSAAPRQRVVAETKVFDRMAEDADAEVRRIIAGNGGRAASVTTAKRPASTPMTGSSAAGATPAPARLAAVTTK